MFGNWLVVRLIITIFTTFALPVFVQGTYYIYQIELRRSVTMRALMGLSTVVVGLTIHFAYNVPRSGVQCGGEGRCAGLVSRRELIILMLINTTMTHSYNTNFSEYLIWFVDMPFNVDDMFDVVFHRKIPFTW